MAPKERVAMCMEACLMVFHGLSLLLKPSSPEYQTHLLHSHFTFPDLRATKGPAICHLFLARTVGFFGSFSGSHFPRVVSVYVQSRDHILLTQRNLLGLPGFCSHVERNVFLWSASLQLSVQNTAESWAQGQAYISLQNTLSHHSLAEHPRRCLFGE